MSLLDLIAAYELETARETIIGEEATTAVVATPVTLETPALTVQPFERQTGFQIYATRPDGTRFCSYAEATNEQTAKEKMERMFPGNSDYRAVKI